MANKKLITVDDLWNLQRLGTPSLSPDGAQAVVSVSRYSMEDNKSHSALWLTSTVGGEPRQLTQAGDKDGQPQWSPQGNLIAFAARREQQGKKDDETQLYVIAPDGGEAVRAADVATGVDAFRWVPGHQGKRLVFVSWVRPELKGNKAQAKAHKAFKERKETGYVTSEGVYRYWDHNLPMGRVAHLHLLELADPADGSAGQVRDLFEGSDYELTRFDPDHNQFDISPDGRRVVFAFDPAPVKLPNNRFALAEIEIKSGKTTVIAKDAAWDFSTPRYSPDGARVAFTASHQERKHTMPANLAVWSRETGTHEVISAEWDHEVHAPLLWEDDGQAVLFCAEQQGRTHLWRFDLDSRRAEVVVAGGWVSGFDKSAGTLVTVADSAMHPSQMHAHAPGAEPLRIENFNDTLMGSLALGRVEEVWFKGGRAAADAQAEAAAAIAVAQAPLTAHIAAPAKRRKTAVALSSSALTAAAAAEGDDVQMWVVYPPGFDPKKKYPLLHNIHGGPHTGPGDNWHYRWNTQLFAAQGYIVASVNYHGSSGFGYAFLDSITHRWGALELQDVEAGTDTMLARRYVDANRVFATGGSYGGFMVAWMNGHVPAGRYKAYVCHAGCFDWVGMFADDAWSWHAKELGAWYWDDMARVQSQSPNAFAANFNTPTLVIHGALDYRVPDAQGLAYYNTLKALNIDSRLLWFPDENHWILKPRNSKLWYGEFFGWLQAHDPGAKGVKTVKQSAAKKAG